MASLCFLSDDAVTFKLELNYSETYTAHIISAEDNIWKYASRIFLLSFNITYWKSLQSLLRLLLFLLILLFLLLTLKYLLFLRRSLEIRTALAL